MRQIALPIDSLRRDSPGSLIVTPCNAAVVRVLSNQADWAGHCAILIGPMRCGKSVMARHFAANPDCTVIDNAEVAGEEALFNAWNYAAEHGERLLLVSHLAPSRWDIALPDLRSRLGSAQLLEIGPPDDELISHLLQKHFQDRGIALTPEVLAFVTRRIERRYSVVEQFAKDGNALAMARGKPVGLALAKELLPS